MLHKEGHTAEGDRVRVAQALKSSVRKPNVIGGQDCQKEATRKGLTLRGMWRGKKFSAWLGWMV